MDIGILRLKVSYLLGTGASVSRLPDVRFGDSLSEFIGVGLLVFVRESFEGVLVGCYVEYGGVRVMDIGEDYWVELCGLVDDYVSGVIVRFEDYLGNV